VRRVEAVAKARWQIHGATLLWGCTSVLGRDIRLPTLPLVLWRVVFSTIAIALWPPVWRAAAAMPRELRRAHAGVGVLLAMHWVAFFGAIKLSNASVGAACLGLATAAVAVIEPLVGQRRIDARELGLGVAVLPGAAMVVGGVPAGMRAGVCAGALAAVLSAWVGAENKRLASPAGALSVVWVQLAAGALFLAVVAALFPHTGPAIPVPDVHDVGELLLLSLGCTLLPFSLYQMAVRHLSAFQIQLTINLEPVYAIALAVLLLHEQRELGALFYAGVAVILAGVFVHPWIARRP
jgi:drug/metabolite transporter (DMT)-like permease